MTCLITGINGFCGQHMAMELLNSGMEAVGIGKEPHCAIPKIPYLRVDLRHEDSLRRAIAHFKPAQIYHLAAQSIPSESYRSRLLTMDINTAGTIRLLRAAMRLKKAPRILLVSSISVYGRTFESSECLDESAPPDPISPYAASKFLMELAGFDFHRRFGLPVYIVRPCNHLGPGMPQSLVAANWCYQIARIEKKLQKPLLQVGNLNVARDFLHVSDVVRAYQMVLKNGNPGEFYGLSSKQPYPLTFFTKALQKISRIPFKCHKDPHRFRRDDLPVIHLKCRKIHALGWFSQHSILDALSALLDSQRKALNSLDLNVRPA